MEPPSIFEFLVWSRSCTTCAAAHHQGAQSHWSHTVSSCLQDKQKKNVINCVRLCVFVCLCRKPTTGRRGRKPTASISMPCDGREVHDGRPSSPPHPSHSVLLLLCHTHIFAQTHVSGQQMDPHLPQNVSFWCSSVLQSDVKYSWSISFIHSSEEVQELQQGHREKSWWRSLTWSSVLDEHFCSFVVKCFIHWKRSTFERRVLKMWDVTWNLCLCYCLSPWFPSFFFISCCRFLLPVKTKRKAFCESTSASQLQLPDSRLAFSSAECRIQPFLSRLFHIDSHIKKKKKKICVCVASWTFSTRLQSRLSV